MYLEKLSSWRESNHYSSVMMDNCLCFTEGAEQLHKLLYFYQHVNLWYETIILMFVFEIVIKQTMK